MLLNLEVIGGAEKLADIEGARHTLYVDDMTLWVTGRRDTTSRAHCKLSST